MAVMMQPACRQVRLQREDFNPAAELQQVAEACEGAVVSFIGSVRTGKGVDRLFLEHYPGMTETALARIADRVAERWPLQALVLIHRIGMLLPRDNIVLVVTAAEHRKAAFDANICLVDSLKTAVPLWKRETRRGADYWIETSTKDRRAASSHSD